jgi:hypothetical protein
MDDSCQAATEAEAMIEQTTLIAISIQRVLIGTSNLLRRTAMID